MNAKRAKALRRLNEALEQERLAFQEMIRRGIPVPVKTMSMTEFNKARLSVADIVANGAPNVLDTLGEMAEALGESQGSIIDDVEYSVVEPFVERYKLTEEEMLRIGGGIPLTREDAFKKISPELHDELNSLRKSGENA